MSALFVTLCVLTASADVATAAPVPSSGSATAEIEIPQGTPVIVHFFANPGYLGYEENDDRVNAIVIQVDRDVVIDGVIVIPQGSLGLAHTDTMNYGSLRQYNGNYFHMLWVFSVASTELTLDPSRVPTKLMHHQLSARTQYTATLMHAIVKLPK